MVETPKILRHRQQSLWWSDDDSQRLALAWTCHDDTATNNSRHVSYSGRVEPGRNRATWLRGNSDPWRQTNLNRARTAPSSRRHDDTPLDAIIIVGVRVPHLAMV